MPTAQENLLFKITVEQTGMTSPQIDSLTKSLQGLGNVLKGTGSGAGKNLQTTLEGIDVQAKNLIATMDKLNASFSRVGTGAAAANLNKIKAEVTQANTAFISGGRAADSYAASMQRIGGPLNNVTSNLNRVVDQLGLYRNSATTANNANLTLTAGFEKLSTSGNIVRNSLATAGESALNYGRQLDSAAAVTQQFGNANQRATSSIQQMTSANEQANTVQKQGVQFDSERANAMVQNIRHISGTALSFMSLYQAMDSVQGIGEMVSLQTEKVQQAQEKENQAIAQFGKDSKQAIQAHEAVAKAMRGLSYEQREANFAMHNMLFMVGLVVIELTNSLLPIILKANTAMKEMGGIGGVAATGFQKFTQSITSSLPSFNMFTLGAGKSAKSAKTMAEEMVGSAPKIGYVGKGLEEVARTADAADPKLMNIGEKAVEVGGATLMGAAGAKELAKGATKAGAGAVEGATGVSLLARVGAVLLGGTVAVAAALAAAGAVAVLYGNNVLGARDAMNGLGVSIGKVHPVLKLIGDGLIVVAGSLGLTGESADKAKGHISELDKTYQTVATTWNNVVASMEASDNKVVQSIGHAVNAIGQSFVKMGNDLRNQVGLSIKTWGEFTAALEQHDYSKAVDIIGQAFGAIPGIIQKIAEDVTGLLINMGKGIISYFQAIKFDQMWTGLWTAIRGMDLELDKRIRAAVYGQANAVQQTIIKWVNDVIVTPINNFAAGIKATAADIWTKIVSGAGSVASTVTTWVNNYIVKPITELPQKIPAMAGQIIDAILKGDIGAKISQWAAGVVPQITKPFTDIGKNTTDAIGGGLGAIGDAVSGALGLGRGPQTATAQPTEQSKPFDIIEALKTGNGTKIEGKNLPATSGAADDLHPFGDNPFMQRSINDMGGIGGGPLSGIQNVSTLGPDGIQHVKGNRPDLSSQNPAAWAAINTPEQDLGPSTGDSAKELAKATGMVTEGPFKGMATAQQQNMSGSMTPPKTDAAPKVETPEDIAKRNKAYGDLTKTVGDLQTQYDGYNEILSNSSLAEDLVTKGTLEQKTALQEAEAGLISSTAANQEYSKQVSSGIAGHVAFNQGVQDTVKQLLDEQVALSNSVGKHTEMGAQLKKGIPQMISFNQGIDDQVGALQDQQRETANTTGKNYELMNQMQDGTAQNAAYAKGFVDSSYAINQQQVAVNETSGSLDAYAVAIGTGQMATIGFGEGVNQVRKQLIDSYVAMEQSKGALLKFNTQLATGIPQAIAYKQALLDQQMASAKLKTEYAGLFGTYQGLVNEMTNGTTVFDMQTKAFAEGLNEAGKWGESMITAAEKERGLMQGTEQMGEILGVKLPGWFRGGSDAAQEFIGVFANIPSVADKVAQSMDQAGQSISQGFGKAMQEGHKAVKDEVKKLEETMGVELPDSMVSALEGSGLGQNMASTLKTFGEVGTQAFNNMPMDDVIQFGQNIGASLQAQFDDMPSEMQAKVQPVMNAIYTELNKGPSDATGGVQAWLNRIITLAGQISPATSTASQALASMSKTDLSAIGKGYEQTLQQISNTTPLSKAQQEFLNTSLKAEGLGQAVFDAQGKITGFTTAAGQVGTAAGQAQTGLTGATTATGQLNTATTTANTTLSSFTTTMGTMASVTQQVLANIVTQFQTTFTTITGVVTTFFSTIVSMVAPNMALFVTQLAPIVPAWQLVFDTIKQAATTFFQELTALVAPAMVQFVAAAEPTIPGFQLIFDTITQNITTTFQTWVQMTQQNVQTITTEVQKLVGVYNDTFNRAVEDAAGYLLKLEQANAKIIQQISSEVQKIVGVFNDAFKRATGDAAGYLNTLARTATQVMQQIAQAAQQAAQMIAGIGQSAQQAAGQVRQLANEINSLQDKTVTITVITRRVTVGAASGMEPTVFMAGGGQVMQTKTYSGAIGNQNSRVIVGESGDETVMRTGMKSNRTIIENVDHIKYIKGLGAKEPEILTVVPLEGTNAMNFRNKHPEYYASGIYNAGSYPSYQPTIPTPIQQPTTYSKMLYGRIIKDKHGNVTIGGRLVFRAGAPLDIDAYEGRHISHGSHGNKKDKKHFQVFDGSNEDIKHNGIPFTFGDLTDNKFVKGMTSGIGGTRGLPVTGAFGSTLNQTPAGPVDIDTIPPASTDRMQASERLYNDYISERVAAARDRPRTQQQDSVNGFVDNQGDPSQIEYNENALPDNQMNSVPPRLLPHHRQGPSAAQRSYEEDYTAFMQKLIAEITKKIDGKIRINLHSQVDTRIWGKITNQQVLNDMVRS